MSEPRIYSIKKRWILNILIIIMMLSIYYALSQKPETEPVIDVPYSEFKQLLNDSAVQSITLKGNKIEGTLLQTNSMDAHKQISRYLKTRIPDIGDERLLPVLEAKRVELKVHPAEEENILWRALLSLLPWILIITFWFWIINRAQRNNSGGLGGKGELGKFLKGSTESAVIPDVTFDDMAGKDSAKREVTELVEFLKYPEQFLQLGAEDPRGVLLMGPPGTGKTLMAKALAGKAEYVFIRFRVRNLSKFLSVKQKKAV